MKNKKETQNVSVEELLEKMTLDEKIAAAYATFRRIFRCRR